MDMGLLYDILCGRTDCPELLSQITFRTPTHRTRHTQLLYVPSHFTSYGQNAVITRIARTYNTTFSTVGLFCTSKQVFMQNIKKLITNSGYLIVSL